jgi:integrase/recombinase XerD
MTSTSSQQPVSALRARMIEDMIVRGFTEKTRNDYIRNVRAFAAFVGRSPDTATAEDLRRFQLHQTQSGMQPPSINSTVSALRFFFTVTLDRPDLARRLTVVRQPRRLPAVLSAEEIVLLLRAAPGPKYKAALATAYGAGLRVSEVVALKVGDVDSERMLLRVERGKGRKDRYAMLSPQLLELLRAWWREGRRLGALLPGSWLFPGRNPIEPLSTRQLNRASMPPPKPPGLKSGCRRIHCATASPPICSNRTPTSGSSKFCSGTPSSTPPPFTRASPTPRSAASPARWTGARHWPRRGQDPEGSRRRWATRGWRSRTSSIAMEPTGGEPMPGM